jgi:membrane dipeptidase
MILSYQRLPATFVEVNIVVTRSLLLIPFVLGACIRPPAATQSSAASSGTITVLPQSSTMGIPGVSERALRVYHDAFVIDTHNDMPTRMLDEHYDADLRNPPGFGRHQGNTDFPRLVESGLTAEFLSAWIDAPYGREPGASYKRAMVYIDTIHAFVARHPDHLLMATSAADVRRAKREGKVAIFIGVEGGHAIESSLDRLRDLYDRGARYLTLTWNNGNEWAGSSIGVEGTRTGGLTPFGRDVIREMNRLGMLVDLSHVSDSTFFDALEVSAAPVIASHSSARAINRVPRNLSDEQLRAIAANGGVVNVNFYSRFIDPDFRESRPTPLSVLIDHFDHIARVAGVDHVGIGSDFDGVSALPQGMEDVTQLPRIAQALLDGGYSESDVKKILGGNMLRVMEQAMKGGR